MTSAAFAVIAVAAAKMRAARRILDVFMSYGGLFVFLSSYLLVFNCSVAIGCRLDVDASLAGTDAPAEHVGVADAYKEWESDFVLFRTDDTILAVGTYTLGSAAEEENEVAEFTKILITEVNSLR